MAIYKFKGFRPVIHETAFVHPTASVIGNVTIGRNVYIGPGASVRGDFGEIIIKDGCNVQDNCVLHMMPGVPVILNENAHIGHGTIIHSATIGKDVLVGMGVVILDNAKIGDGSIIAAMSLITTEMEIPQRKLAAGIPAEIKKDVSDKMLAWKTEGTLIYQKLPKHCANTLCECEPLRRPPAFKPKEKSEYKTWKEVRKNNR